MLRQIWLLVINHFSTLSRERPSWFKVDVRKNPRLSRAPALWCRKNFERDARESTGRLNREGSHRSLQSLACIWLRLNFTSPHPAGIAPSSYFGTRETAPSACPSSGLQRHGGRDFHRHMEVLWFYDSYNPNVRLSCHLLLWNSRVLTIEALAQWRSSVTKVEQLLSSSLPSRQLV